MSKISYPSITDDSFAFIVLWLFQKESKKKDIKTFAALKVNPKIYELDRKRKRF